MPVVLSALDIARLERRGSRRPDPLTAVEEEAKTRGHVNSRTLANLGVDLGDLASLDASLEGCYGSARNDPELIADLAAQTITAYCWLNSSKRADLGPGAEFLAQVNTWRVVRQHITVNPEIDLSAGDPIEEVRCDWYGLRRSIVDPERPLVEGLTFKEAMVRGRVGWRSAGAEFGRVVDDVWARVSAQKLKYGRVGAGLYLKRAALVGSFYRKAFRTPWWSEHVRHIIVGEDPQRLSLCPGPGQVGTLLRRRCRDDLEHLVGIVSKAPWQLSEAEASAFAACGQGPTPAYARWRRTV